jgi:crossover junction endodeoxyribonuclease RuvC
MRILGIDPGSRVTGWGVLDCSGWEIRFVALGVVRTGDGDELGARLCRLAAGLREVIRSQAPDVAVVEQVFSARNARSALVLGHARGVVLLAAGEASLVIHEYAPTQVKTAVTGSGRAEKEQVQAALAAQLGLRTLPSPLDASDALAVALCHAATARFTSKLSRRDEAVPAVRSRRPSRLRL